MNIIQIAFGGKLNEDKKRSVSFLFEHGVSLTDHDFLNNLVYMLFWYASCHEEIETLFYRMNDF